MFPAQPAPWPPAHNADCQEQEKSMESASPTASFGGIGARLKSAQHAWFDALNAPTKLTKLRISVEQNAYCKLSHKNSKMSQKNPKESKSDVKQPTVQRYFND